MTSRDAHRYDTLLRVRKRQEEIQAQVLAVANRSVQVARAQRNTLAQERQDAFQHAGQLIDPHFDASVVTAVLMADPLPAPPRAGVTVFVFRSEVN